MELRKKIADRLVVYMPSPGFEDAFDEALEVADAILAIPELVDALEALQLQALQSELNDPAHEWGREALDKTRTILAKVRSQQ